MIRKITGKNSNTPTKDLIHNNVKITDEKNIANHLAENSSSKNQAKIFKAKAEKVKIKFSNKNTESYNQPSL